MRTEEIVREISVCQICMFEHANGEYPGDPSDKPADEPEAWALWGFGYSATMGGEHGDGCAEESREADGCDCDQLGFSWSPCEGCGNHLGGDRYRFTTWRLTNEAAHVAARSNLSAAHSARVNGDHTTALAKLSLAAEYRAYLAERAAEDHRFAHSMAAYGAGNS